MEDYDDKKFKYSKEQYKDPPEESNFIFFEEDYNDQKQKLWMCNINHINCSTDRHIGFRGSKQPPFFTIELKKKGKGNIISDGCFNTSVSAIENVFVEFLRTESKVTIVVTNDKLSKKYIMIGDATTPIGLLNGTFIA